MNYLKIEPTRALPESDSLFRFENGLYVRLRVTAKTNEGAVRNETPSPGVAETVNVKLQCSLCKDDSGDVRTDATGNNLLLAAEVHGVTVESLIDRNQSFEAWLAGCVDDALQKANRKSYVIDEVLARYVIPPE